MKCLSSSAVLLLAVQLYGCATPSQRFSNMALEYGFSSAIESSTFQHRLYLNQAVYGSADKKVLHVYLDGDGTPWRQQRWVAKDPTARNPLILELMALDKHPAILLGRPCYYGLNLAQTCHYKFWTSHRYSEVVRDSLVKALKQWLFKHPYQQVVLIGYSGGGTLAALMAPYITQTVKLITVAANLDVAAWSHYHGYQGLQDSLNPIEQPVLKPVITQLHLAGEEDETVPPEVVKAYSDKQKQTDLKVLNGFDHTCCWSKIWSKIIN